MNSPMKGYTSSFVGLALSLAAVAAIGQSPATTAPPPKHLLQAEQLVDNLKGAQENVYGGGKRHIDWNASNYAARTVCSSFITLLLEHTYGWPTSAFKVMMGTGNPQAEDYHDAIVSRRGFKRIVHVTAIRPGDILAVKYTGFHVTSRDVEDTGHVMLVAEAPTFINDEKPIISGTRQYTVTIIDSSASGHGPTDTRHEPGGHFTGGIGRGTIRLYAGDDDKIAGYTWSNTPKSEYFTAPERDIVAGRLKSPEQAYKD